MSNTSGGAMDVSFHNITYTVQKGDKRIDILRGVSGTCRSSRMLAIMGASGAGKTTLLDILAGQTMPGGTVGGTILVNGAPRRRREFQRASCYVLQRDVLLASSTVREALVTSALLKLPRALSTAEKLARVDDIIQQLDLVECQHTLIGDETLQMKGISGGQKRRVSVGLELVKDPRAIFLDECTSGLDSETAASLVDTLLGLARKGRTVVLTIHQPNSIITSKFDDFMLLGAGRLVYAGAWHEAVDFFAGCGHPCPAMYNPSDFFMQVLRDTQTIESLADAFQKRSAIAPAFVDLEVGGEGDKDDSPQGSSPQAGSRAKPGPLAMELAQQLSAAEEAAAAASAQKMPFYYQVLVLMDRMFKMWLRNPAMLTAELIQYVFLAIFIGLMYLRSGHSVSTGVNDRAASIWFAFAMLCFTPSYTAVTQWDRERLLLRREASSGMYSVRAWFTAKTATVTPVQLVQTAAFCLVAYWMVGYVSSASQFLIFLGIFCMFQLTSESVGVLCAALARNATYAVLVLTFVMLFVLSFSGFLVSDVPVYFRWVQKINYLTYAYSAVLTSQFDATTFYDEAGQPVAGSTLLPPSVDTGLSVAGNSLVLMGIMVATRLLAYLSIEAGVLFKLI